MSARDPPRLSGRARRQSATAIRLRVHLIQTTWTVVSDAESWAEPWPTGIPLVYERDAGLRPAQGHYYHRLIPDGSAPSASRAVLGAGKSQSLSCCRPAPMLLAACGGRVPSPAPAHRSTPGASAGTARGGRPCGRCAAENRIAALRTRRPGKPTGARRATRCATPSARSRRQPRAADRRRPRARRAGAPRSRSLPRAARVQRSGRWNPAAPRSDGLPRGARGRGLLGRRAGFRACRAVGPEDLRRRRGARPPLPHLCLPGEASAHDRGASRRAREVGAAEGGHRGQVAQRLAQIEARGRATASACSASAAEQPAPARAHRGRDPRRQEEDPGACFADESRLVRPGGRKSCKVLGARRPVAGFRAGEPRAGGRQAKQGRSQPQGQPARPAVRGELAGALERRPVSRRGNIGQGVASIRTRRASRCGGPAPERCRSIRTGMRGFGNLLIVDHGEA